MLEVKPASGIDAGIRVPGSKSLTNRALVLGALAEGKSCFEHVLFSDDTNLMLGALNSFAIEINVEKDKGCVSIVGSGGDIAAGNRELWLGNSGTCVRFLTAFSVLAPGTTAIDGDSRMRERPIRDLVDALLGAGCRIEYLGKPGYPPIRVFGDGFPGGAIRMAGDQSSQFLSALLMVAGHGKEDLVLKAQGEQGELVSKPYLTMTADLMQKFGVSVNCDWTKQEFFVQAGQHYRAVDYTIEPDASGASYFLGAAAILGGRVTLVGLGSASLQGDVQFARVLEKMGCNVRMERDSLTLSGAPLRGIDIDLNDMPDMVMTLAVVALFAKGKTRIRNVANLRIKETDRLSALYAELRKLGAKAEVFSDGIEITPAELHGAIVETYRDHRMAMSFYLAGFKIPGIVLQDETCVNKTYPDFFRDMDKVLKREHQHG